MPYFRIEPERPEPWRAFRTHARYPVLVPFFFIEWVLAHVANALSRWSLVLVLEYASSFSVLIVVIFWFVEANDRVQQRHYQAWQVINTAQGKGGSGGRVDALEQLNGDHVPLVGVDVSGAFLQNIKLERAELRRADMSAADMRGAKLAHAAMPDANLRSTNLRGADLRGADLSGAALNDADLTRADLSGASLGGASLETADLRGVDLSGVSDWRTLASVRGANLAGVKNAPDGFLRWAQDHGASDTPATSP